MEYDGRGAGKDPRRRYPQNPVRILLGDRRRHRAHVTDIVYFDEGQIESRVTERELSI